MPYMAWFIKVNIGLGNGLLPDSSKALAEPLMTYYHHVLRNKQWSWNQNTTIFIQVNE